ncbi:tRNA glutamyl-Q(34) synthetase GluQRS [Pseudoxanthomonas sacheonensis]|uniref:Glutamyl-Q tRNA(Asp) synthetase n=1 Tax=Pseudoxanthomonas sacheonensis TaxID=443615 RepID=A0ABU1RQR7_9GAMM|nr:tRNA glutamyl-Q(34) synthetase GluQRS [Pseudoxanthomonas sacheonensis]MDR6841112.1 glutamyl-Q tRNA(Asp) synthetase [Pseudoxanthomonas sacheonensis]
MPDTSSYRGRFAPSPTGPLHFGSLVAALGSWLLARHANGQWLVRMEDLDPPREVAGAAAQQLAALDAFGLRSDGAVEWQSRRSDVYQIALDRLLAEGKAFACHCSRSQLAASNGVHHRCAGKAQRTNPAIRLRVPPGTTVSFEDSLQGGIAQDVGREVGDFVLKRADGLWAYQLAVVVDDAAQGMTDIVRGADLLDSTPRQILLQQALGLPTPRYLHLPLILDAGGQKLSKSSEAPAVDAGDPLPALHAAWLALGQASSAVEVSFDAASFLASAKQAFTPDRLPSVTSLSLAALHNAADANAV